MDFLDIKTVYTIIHLFGVALGAGGAFLSDFIFLKSLKDQKISRDEFSILKTASLVVWIGIILFVFSGVGLFTLDHESLLQSSKFLVKTTIVAIIIINGLIFHFIHLPRIDKSTNRNLFRGDEVKGKASFLVLSGVVSVVSWASAIILGALRAVPYSYLTIMFFYVLLILVGVVFAWILEHKILSEGEKKSLGGAVVVLGSLLIISVIVLTQLRSDGVVFDNDNAAASAIETKEELKKLDLAPTVELIPR